ncbi:hypothetical protein NHJ13734_008117 [Beauveria thailandica]
MALPGGAESNWPPQTAPVLWTASLPSQLWQILGRIRGGAEKTFAMYMMTCRASSMLRQAKTALRKALVRASANMTSLGINLAFAKLLLAKGCNVVVADIKLRPESEALLSEYSSSSDGAPRAVFVKTDVSAWEDLRNMLDRAVSEFGSFEVVCPGAGVFEPPTSNFWHPPGSDTSRDFVDANHYTALDINLTHPIRATQLALQHWLKPENAAQQTPESPKRVVNVASIAGYTPVFHCPLYAAAKYGVVGFTRSLAHLDAVAGIRVSAIAPGVVSTPMINEHPEDIVDADKDALITPQEVAEAMLSLVESEDHAGGTVLEVGVAYTRTVSVWNDPGPTQELHKGTTLSGMENVAVNIAKTLQDGTWQNK